MADTSNPKKAPIWYRIPMAVVRVGLAISILWLCYSCVWGILNVFSGPVPRTDSVDATTRAQHSTPDLLGQLAGGGWLFGDSPWEIKVRDPSSLDNSAQNSPAIARSIPIGDGQLRFGETKNGRLTRLEYSGPVPGGDGRIIHLVAEPRSEPLRAIPFVLPANNGSKQIAVRIGVDGKPVAEIVQVSNLDRSLDKWAKLGWLFESVQNASPEHLQWKIARADARWDVVGWKLPGDSQITLFVIREAEIQ